MTRKAASKSGARGNSRLRAELVEGAQSLYRLGAYSAADVKKTTIRMLGRDSLPKVPPLTPKEIVAVREHTGVSQAVMAGLLNVATKTLGQWERGERRPTGAALKLLHVVKTKGLEAVR